MGFLLFFIFLNYFLVVKNSVFLRFYVYKEFVYCFICGFFIFNFFDINCVIFLFLCVLKCDFDEFRVVYDLSFFEGFFVNDGIVKDFYFNELFRFCLFGIDCLVEFVNKEGSGCYVFKKDLSCVYC